MGESLRHKSATWFPTLKEMRLVGKTKTKRQRIKGHHTVYFVSHFVEEVVVMGYSPFMKITNLFLWFFIMLTKINLGYFIKSL